MLNYVDNFYYNLYKIELHHSEYLVRKTKKPRELLKSLLQAFQKLLKDFLKAFKGL